MPDKSESSIRGGWRSQLPVLGWMRSYRREDLTGDVAAGVTVWAVLVPQALAYAALAGVPAVVGLYAALGAMALYAVFGTSRELNVGPEGTIAILVATIVAPLAGGDPGRYVAMTAALAIITGIVCFLGALFRLGWITRFLSRPILTGYVLGSAVIIAASQVGGLLGIDASDLGAFFSNVGDTHLPTLTVGVATIVVILVVRSLGPRLPAYLVGMVIATLIVVIWDLSQQGVAVVGAIEPGLPGIGLPDIRLGDLPSLIGPGLAVALLLYADSMLTEKSLAKMSDYEVDPNQEFIALGAANIGSGLFGGFSVNGSQTRSVVNLAAGAKTQLSNLASLVLVVLTLLFLTPLFESLPQTALAGVLIVAATGLVDIPGLRRIWELNRGDFWLAVTTAVLVVSTGVLTGIVIAIILSLLDAAIKPFRAHTAVLGRVPGSDRYRDVEQVADAQTIPGLLVYRFDAPLYFANAEIMTEEILKLVDDADGRVREVILSAEAIVTIDSSGHEALHELIDDLHERDVRFSLARAKPALLDVLAGSGLYSQIDNTYLEVDEGIAAFENREIDPERPSEE